EEDDVTAGGGSRVGRLGDRGEARFDPRFRLTELVHQPLAQSRVVPEDGEIVAQPRLVVDELRALFLQMAELGPLMPDRLTAHRDLAELLAQLGVELVR